MPFDHAEFTRDVREIVAQVPEQRADDAPYGWFDPEWVRVESTVFGVDGTVTRSAGWVRREEWCREWFRNGESPAQPSE